MPWPTIWGGEPKQMSEREQTVREYQAKRLEQALVVSSKARDAFYKHVETTGQAPSVILFHPRDIELLKDAVTYPASLSKLKKFMNIPVRQSADVEQGNCEVF